MRPFPGAAGTEVMRRLQQRNPSTATCRGVASDTAGHRHPNLLFVGAAWRSATGYLIWIPKKYRGARAPRLPGGTVVTPKNAIAFVRSHGIVLESARGPVPILTEAVAGERIQG